MTETEFNDVLQILFEHRALTPPSFCGKKTHKLYASDFGFICLPKSVFRTLLEKR